jgi:hypothetical protein
MTKPRQDLDGPELEAALCHMCDYIRSRPKLEPASRAAGFGSKYIWNALKRSEAGDPRYLIAWPDRDAGEKIQFFEAVKLAIRQFKLKFSTTLYEESERGVPRLQIAGGRVMYEEDAELLARFGDGPDAKEIAALCGYPDFPYKHRINENGKEERIPLTVMEHVPATLRVHVARSILPGMNPPEHRSTVTSHSGSVMVIKQPWAKDYVPPNAPLRHDLPQRLADLRKRAPKPSPQLPTPRTDDTRESAAAQPMRRAPANVGHGPDPSDGGRGFKIR